MVTFALCLSLSLFRINFIIHFALLASGAQHPNAIRSSASPLAKLPSQSVARRRHDYPDSLGRRLSAVNHENLQSLLAARVPRLLRTTCSPCVLWHII